MFRDVPNAEAEATVDAAWHVRSDAFSSLDWLRDEGVIGDRGRLTPR